MYLCSSCDDDHLSVIINKCYFWKCCMSKDDHIISKVPATGVLGPGCFLSVPPNLSTIRPAWVLGLGLGSWSWVLVLGLGLGSISTPTSPPSTSSSFFLAGVHGPEYLALSAADKMARVWANSLANQTSANWLSQSEVRGEYDFVVGEGSRKPKK